MAGHGFEVENLVPALCLMLFYFLLQRRMIASIVTAIVVISVKEDAPIAAAMVAIVAGVETWISSPGKPARCRFNWPAAITLILSVSAIPLLLAISWLQPPTMYAPHSLDRLGIVAPGTLSGPGALFVFVASNMAHWLGSSVVRQWLWVMIVGSFWNSLVASILFGCRCSHNAGRMAQEQERPPMGATIFSTATILWCVTLVGFASIARTVSHCSKTTRPAVLTAAIAITALSASAQLALVPKAREAYLLRSDQPLLAAGATGSGRVFARYRREGNPRNLSLPQRCFSATRMTEISSV